MKNFLTSLALLGLTSSLTLTLNINGFEQSAFAQSAKAPATDLTAQDKPRRKLPSKIQQSCAARSTNRNPASRMKPLNVPKRYIIQSSGDRPAKPSNRILPSIVSPNPVDVTVINSTPVNNKPIRFIIYDFSIDQSGGIVDLFLNGKFFATVNLTVSGKVVTITSLRRGINTLGIAGVQQPCSGPIILSLQFARTDLLPEEPYVKSLVVRQGESKFLTLGFPLVGFSKAKYPQSAQHVLDAWANPPKPMQPPIPGKPANPLRPFYPRLLTVDRPGANQRGSMSVKNYACPTTGQQKDEYPPKVFLQNGGDAHIKCINGSDNAGSGSAFAKYLTNYEARPGATGVKIPDGAVIEFILLP